MSWLESVNTLNGVKCGWRHICIWLMLCRMEASRCRCSEWVTSLRRRVQASAPTTSHWSRLVVDDGGAETRWIYRISTLFASWQQRCCLSLSICSLFVWNSWQLHAWARFFTPLGAYLFRFHSSHPKCPRSLFLTPQKSSYRLYGCTVSA